MAPSNETEKTIITHKEYCDLINELDKKIGKDFKLRYKSQLKMMIQLMYHSGMRISNILYGL